MIKYLVLFYRNRKTVFFITYRYNATDMLSDFVQEPGGTFENFCRMSQDDFTFLLNKVGPYISKFDTNMRQCILIQEQFAIALRFSHSSKYKCLDHP